MLRRFGNREESGAAAAELSLILPALMLILLGTEEFGRLLWTKSLLDHAVNEAARCGSVNATTCGSSDAIATYAVQRSRPLSLSTSVFTATSPSCGSQVAASYPFTFVVPSLLPFNITLSARACFPK